MAKKQSFDVNDIVHPGFILGMELKVRGLTQKRFAEIIAIQQSHLSEIIKGKRNITDQLAEKLEQNLNIPADHWIRLQAEYGYKVKAANLRNIAESDAESMLSEYNEIYDMRLIFKYTGLSSRLSSEKMEFCKKKLHFGTPTAQRRFVQGCFHRSEKTGLDTRMIATWAVLAKFEAARRANPDRVFDRDKMDNLAEELRVIFNENHNTINRVERTLSHYGIIFCVVPKVERASIDGYSFFIDGKPAIVVTMRYNRIDNIAFAVLHEVGHLKLHSAEDDGGNINLAYAEEELITKEEVEANEYAANALIPKYIWDNVPRVLPIPRYIQREYSKWAKNHQLNKWIVLGRLSHETGIYMFKSDSSREIN